jgi:predicted PurR-regulated permease PerM
VVDLAADADSIIQQANQKLQEIQQKVQELFDKINGLLSWVPSFLSGVVDAIKDAVDKFNQKLQEFWTQVEKFFSEPGSPSALKQAAQAWENTVSKVISNVTGSLSTDQLQAENDWQGQAANAYKSTIPSQTAALNSIKGIADQVNTSLNDLAGAVIAFWVAIGAALLTFIVGLVGAIAACCTVVGTPAGIAAAVGVIAVVLGLVTTAILTLTSYLNSVSAEQASLGQKLNDNSTFPNGKWPVSTSDMSDDHGGWQVV